MNTNQKRADSSWQPACGGLEQPFTMMGKIYMYMWNRVTHEHAYYCQTDDLFISNNDWLALIDRRNGHA